MSRTKIVCTIGPTSDSPEIISKLISEGMNVARLNFSHGSHEDHRHKIELIRELSEKLGKPIAILQDLCGPKIRVGEIKEPGIRLEPGQTFTLTNEKIVGSGTRVFVSYENLPEEVSKNDRILLADGLMEVEVESTTSTDITCRVITGGVLTSHKGINLPTGTIKTSALTEKDATDLVFGLAHDVDFVALSFVRSADDIAAVKKIITEKKKSTPVIAKIEKHEAIDHMDEILDAADGIMVARGDLGVEIPLEKVPGIQKMLVRRANMLGKPVIIATQMLRSMVNSPRPTRAEATDVANAVLDGTDAVMLSEETASGDYPVEAVQFMTRIINTAEENYPHAKYLSLFHTEGVSETVAYASCILAGNLHAAAIVATTRSGSTAVHIARFRPICKIIALTPDRIAARRLCLNWGCMPCYLELKQDTDEMIEDAAQSALQTGLVEKGDQVVITAGRPVWAQGTTNMLWVKSL
ncbi:MAG: pyruvate kinase [Desulfobacteraceae bacterium]|nr:pyruvate kinase [Desulfobacteraceae bacterium]